jgi:actin related protein 2/3 complex subunit 1A/1B
MSDPKVFQLGHEPIKSHVFSNNKDILAITKGTNVEIYQVGNLSTKPKLFAVLKEHDKTVTSVDISPDGSSILTCSQDRNALVWQWDSHVNEFKPTLVLLRISRAATCCKWSPDGKKFAVASSDRVVAVCYYEEENNWWVSKHLKKPLKSTITSLDWHPDGVLLACGSTDGHARVFSAYIKGLDEKPPASVWGTKLPFQTLCGDYVNETGAWVHDVAFSPDGNALAYVSHDASVGVVYPDGEGQPPRSILSVTTDNLPLKAVVFLSNNKIVVGGYSCNLLVLEGDESNWAVTRTIEPQNDATTQPVGQDEDEEISSHQALNMFRQMDLKGRTQRAGGGAKQSNTTHQNTIESIQVFSQNQVSTGGIDGKVAIFTI